MGHFFNYLIMDFFWLFDFGTSYLLGKSSSFLKKLISIIEE